MLVCFFSELQSVSKKLRIAEENVRVMKDWVQQRQAATVQQLEQVMGELEAERSNKNAQMAEWEETKEFMAEELNKVRMLCCSVQVEFLSAFPHL